MSLINLKGPKQTREFLCWPRFLVSVHNNNLDKTSILHLFNRKSKTVNSNCFLKYFIEFSRENKNKLTKTKILCSHLGSCCGVILGIERWKLRLDCFFLTRMSFCFFIWPFIKHLSPSCTHWGFWSFKSVVGSIFLLKDNQLFLLSTDTKQILKRFAKDDNDKKSCA